MADVARDDSGAITDSTSYTGSGYFTEVTVGATDGEEATLSATITGNGPMTRTPIT